MRTQLPNNATLKLTSVFNTDDTIINYDIKIESFVGEGASCLVYTVIYTRGNDEKTRGILKECWPAKRPALDIHREDNSIVIGKGDITRFERHLERFKTFYKKNKELMHKHPGLTNWMIKQDDLLRPLDMRTGHGTYYSLSEYISGTNMSDNMPQNANEVFHVALSAARALKHYHEAEQVYLDFKKENLFVHPRNVGSNHVMFFDTDAAADILALHEDTSYDLFSTPGWEAPEMKRAMLEPRNLEFRKRINIKTDFYLVGLLVDECLKTGYVESISDARKWEYDISNAMLKDTDPAVSKKLHTFLKKTLSVEQWKRYQTDIELIKALEELTEKSNPSAHFLHTMSLRTPELFVGRDNELQALTALLKSSKAQNTAFLKGIGGIGKSELALEYISRFKNNYDSIIKIDYSGSLATDIIHQVRINNFNPFEKADGLDSDAIFNGMVYPKLSELCNNRVLLFIDNFNTYEQSDLLCLSKLMKLSCSIIVTSRNDYEDYIPGSVNYKCDTNRTVNVEPESNLDNLKKIFYCNGPHIYQTDDDGRKKVTKKIDSAVETLVTMLSGHTLAIKLVANLLREYHGDIELPEIVNGIRRKGLENRKDTRFRCKKDDLPSEEKTVSEHIKSIFDFSKIRGEKRELLKVLTFIPHSGIYQKQLRNWCGLFGVSGRKSLNSLIREGWVQKDNSSNQERVSLHPVISDVCRHTLVPKLGKGLLSRYTSSLINSIANNDEDITIVNLQEYVAFFLTRIKERSVLAGEAYQIGGSFLVKQGRIVLGIESLLKALSIQKREMLVTDSSLLVTYTELAEGLSLYKRFAGKLWADDTDLFITMLHVELSILSDLDKISYNALKVDADIGFDIWLGGTILALQIREAEIYKAKNKIHHSDCLIHVDNILKFSRFLNKQQLSQCYHFKAEAHYALGHYQEALSCEEKALEFTNEQNGNTAIASDIYIGLSRNSYMLFYLHRALNYAHEAMLLREAFFAHNHPLVAEAYNNIAECYEAVRQPEIAKNYKQKAHAIEKYYKQDEYSVLESEEQYSVLRGTLNPTAADKLDAIIGRYDELKTDRQSFQEKRGFFETELEESRQKLVINKKQLADECYSRWVFYRKNESPYNALQKANRAYELYVELYKETYGAREFSEAFKYAKRIVILTETHYPNATLHLSCNYCNMATCLYSLGKYKQSLTSARKALSIRMKESAENGSDVASYYNLLSLLYEKLGNHKKQLHFELLKLDIYLAYLPQDDDRIMNSLITIKSCCIKLKKYDNAYEYSNRILEMQLLRNPINEQAVILCCYELYETCSALGLHKEAISYRKTALEHFGEPTQKNCLDYADYCSKLGVDCSNVGYSDDALKYGLIALEIRNKALPENHLDRALSYNNVGKAYSDVNDYKNSIDCLTKSLGIAEVSPKDCTFKGNIHCNLGVAYSQVGQSSLAIGHLLLAVPLLEKQNNKAKLIVSYNQLIELYTKTKRLNEANDCKQKVSALISSVE